VQKGRVRRPSIPVAYCRDCGAPLDLAAAAENDGVPLEEFLETVLPAPCFICDECVDAWWDPALEEACLRCRSKPCRRGRECWFDPAMPWPYLTVFAPRRVSAFARLCRWFAWLFRRFIEDWKASL